MTTEPRLTAPAGESSRWLTIGRILFVAVLVVAFLALGLSMAHHRFFEGGRIDARGVITQ